MRAILYDQPGGAEVLHLGEVAAQELDPRSIRIRVVTTALNRADILQRRGFYPPPPGASSILGLECAGIVSEVGSEVTRWSEGDAVAALLTGGGYAEQLVVPAECVLPIPAGYSWAEAGAFPEVFLTVFLNVFQLGGFEVGQSVLVHGGASGIGTAAIGMVKEAGGRILVTAGSDERCRRCLDLGADGAVNYRERDFQEEVKVLTEGRGVDIVLDCVGGAYLERNVKVLASGGSLIIIGLLGGSRGEISLGELVSRRLRVIGSTLRARPAAEKAELIRCFLDRFHASLESGSLRPTIDRVLPLERVAEAHRAMEAGEHFGKIVLQVCENEPRLPNFM